MKLDIILFLVLHVISAYSSSHLIDKAAFLANSVFKEFISAIVWRHDNPDDVADFMKQYEGCVVLTPIQENDNTIIRKFNKNRIYRQTVFFATSVYELEYFIVLLNQDLVSPIRLIVVLKNPSTNAELSELMQIAWKNDVADILIVSSNTKEVTLTTYFPYSNGKCGDNTPVHLDHDTKDIFPKKFTNFQQCEIRATLLHMSPYSRLEFKNDTLKSITGIDGNVFDILFAALNASMKVVSTKDHGGTGTIVNGTATGSFADLVNKSSDILCPALIMSHVRYPYVQFSHAYESVNIFWFGPRRREISEWLRVVQSFMTYLTPALFASFVVFVSVTAAVRRFGQHRAFSRRSVLFQSFIIFLGQEVNFITKSWLSNSLFMLWIWFCMVVRIAYQGDLVHGLQNTIIESPLGSFETAVKAAYDYGGIDTFREFFTGTPYYRNYKVIPFGKSKDFLKTVEAGERFLISSDRLMAMDAAPNLQFLSNVPVTQVPTCFYMRPGWPAVADIDEILYQMIEAGFTQKSIRQYEWEWTKKIKSMDDRDAKPLTMDILIGCFYGLGFMYAVCILVFILEIIQDKVENRLNRPRFCSKKLRIYQKKQ